MDGKYILLVFQDGEINIGCKAWILNNEKCKISDVQLQKLIDNHSYIKIKWPNGIIEPVTEVQNKKKYCIWQIRYAKLIAFGEYIDLCEYRKNYEMNFLKRDRNTRSVNSECDKSKTVNNVSDQSIYTTSILKSKETVKNTNMNIVNLVYKRLQIEWANETLNEDVTLTDNLTDNTLENNIITSKNKFEEPLNLNSCSNKNQRLIEVTTRLQNKMVTEKKIEINQCAPETEINECISKIECTNATEPANVQNNCINKVKIVDESNQIVNKNKFEIQLLPSNDNKEPKNPYFVKPSLYYSCTEGISLRKINEPQPFMELNFLQNKKICTINIQKANQLSKSNSSKTDEQTCEPIRERKYACDLCEKAYYRGEHLRRHKRKIHEAPKHNYKTVKRRSRISVFF